METELLKDALTDSQRSLLEMCGADAQAHPLIDRDGVLRFKADPVVRYVVDNVVDLNKLWVGLGPLSHDIAVRHSLRRFYRDMGYSLSGYLEVFGEELDEEYPRPETGIPAAGLECALKGRVPGDRITVVPGDVSRMDFLEEFILTGVIAAGFEIDGGIHLTVCSVGDTKETAYREKNTLREAIDEFIENRKVSPQ